MVKRREPTPKSSDYIPSPLPHVLVALIQPAVVAPTVILAFRRLAEESYYELKISLVTLRLAWASQGNPDSDNSTKGVLVTICRFEMCTSDSPSGFPG